MKNNNDILGCLILVYILYIYRAFILAYKCVLAWAKV